MYGHALNLLPQCSVESCTRPAMVIADDDSRLCAACAREALTTLVTL